MAGFFGIGDFTKEGPGVPKDGPQKSRFIIFFEVLFRKFWQLIRINIMYLIFNIPGIIISFFIANILLGYLASGVENPETIFGDGTALVILIFFIMAMITTFPIVTTGPSHAGFTFLLRNYSREEHAFIWSDFKEHMKKNLKQSIIVSLINIVLFVLLIFQLYFYLNYTGLGILKNIAFGFVIVMILLLFMIIMYIYPMMVTFKLSIKQMYKNALIFSIIRFLPNLFILIICFGFIFFSFYFQPLVGFLIYFLFGFAFINFLINFYVYPKLKKFIMNKIDTDEEPKEEIESEFVDTV
jgi:uncharacterized membrane protein YesL